MTALREPRILQGERFAVTVLLALALHALVILGLTFDWPTPATPSVTQMEVTLVAHKDEPPDDARYLAQANQRGAGDPDAPKQRPQDAAAPPPAAPDVAPDPSPAADPPPTPPSPAPEVLSAPRPEAPAAPPPEQAQTPEPAQPAPLPSAGRLLERSREIAQLSAEVLERQDAYDKRLRRAYISASTREYLYASYEEAWRNKVERLGNQHYPAEARRRNLSGRLIMDVSIKPDGSLEEIKIVQSSGHAVLDDAARQIVQRGAPYAPFPANMREQVDVLHIIRIWEFLGEHRLTTR